MMEWVALSAGRCGSEYVEYSKLDFETFKWVYTITPSIVYSIIIIIIILVFLCGKRVGGIYVTKHKD